WNNVGVLAKYFILNSPELLKQKYFHHRKDRIEQNQTLLMLTVASLNSSANTELVIFLLDNRADVNDENDQKHNALVVACSVKNIGVAAILLRYGAKLTVTQMQYLQNNDYKVCYEEAFSLAMTQCISIIADSKPLQESEIAFLKNNLDLFK